MHGRLHPRTRRPAKQPQQIRLLQLQQTTQQQLVVLKGMQLWMTQQQMVTTQQMLATQQ
jgi:hypothetical protein